MLVLDRTIGDEPRAALARLALAALLAGGTGALGCASDPQGGEDRTNGAMGAGTGAQQPGGSGTGAQQPGGSAGTGSSTTAGTGSSMPSAGTGSTPTAGTGGSEMVDCSALPPPSNPDDMISTFEDGTGNVQQVAGRGGGFYMYNDMTGTQMPPPGMLPDARMDSRCGGMFALCMSGSGFTEWGAGMGTDLGLTDMATMTKGTYDASVYTGISFWAKANPGSALAIRVSLKDANTAPEGGNCDATMSSGAEACNDDWGKNITLTTSWAPYTVTFSELRQAMWGKQFPSFDSAAVYAVQFQVNKGLDFDLCIDDLAFVR